MPTMQQLPPDHPTMVAWKTFCESDDFQNALQWAFRMQYDDGRFIEDSQREQHALGAMWLAFTRGMDAVHSNAQTEETPSQ